MFYWSKELNPEGIFPSGFQEIDTWNYFSFVALLIEFLEVNISMLLTVVSTVLATQI